MSENWKYYTKEQAEELKLSVIDVRCETLELVNSYLRHTFKDDRARDYAWYGLCRRLSLMRHCMERVFELIPPDITQPPEQRSLNDATAFLHAFTINAFGCMDNLAHVWVKEKNVRGKTGPLQRNQIGFSSSNTKVLLSLTGELHDYVTGEEFRQWHDCYLKPWRHPLAHRIPFYVPPHVYVGDESSRIVSFAPFAAVHGGGEEQTMLSFHPQMIADLRTIAELASILLIELRDQGLPSRISGYNQHSSSVDRPDTSNSQ